MVDAVAGHVPNAVLLHERDPEVVQGAVARGTALHAMSLAMTGRGAIAPVTGDSIFIRTTSGLVPLVAQGTPLPFPPGGGWATNADLAVPETRISRPLVLRISYRMDENQNLNCLVSLEGDPDRGEWPFRKENPLCNVVNPQVKRQRILEIEETLKTETVDEAQAGKLAQEAATLCGALGRREKAMDIWKSLLARRGGDPGILNRMGILAGEMGDLERQEKFYREAAAAERSWGIPLFNLALAK